MFQTEESIIADSLALLSIEANYVINPGDKFEMTVSGNNGEMIIDPDNLLKNELGMLNNQGMTQTLEYLVLEDSTAKLPVIGNQLLAGKTINEANVFLAEQFEEYYKSAFVNISILNKRIIFFGPSGGKVIPLENENMNLLEALALSGEIDQKAYVDNIRLIRGNLNKPNVQLIDLSTIDGMRKANLALKPNDIVYVEPKKTLAGQALRENVLPYVTVLTSITQAVLLYLTLRNN